MVKRLFLSDIEKKAQQRKGKCLSNTYINSKTKLKFICAEGHEWESRPNDIMNNHWCPECAKYDRSKSLRDTIENMQKLATRFGGKCLSLKYTNSTTNLEWQCKYGHKFEIAPVKVKDRQQWCHYCRSRLIGEKICRAYFEAIFEKKFKKYKPKDLLSIKETILEFDGYNNELNLAFEYHGAQHYGPVKMFLRKRTFDDQKTVDAIKTGYCMAHLIHFIEVPYTISYENMGRFIVREAEKKGFKIPKEKHNIDYHTFHIYKSELIEEMMEIAKEKKGSCLSKSYIDNLSLLEFQCEKGHRWKTTPKMIKKGHWCPICSGNIRKSLDDVHKIVEIKKGKILEGDYINNRSKLLIKCEEDHIFSTNYHELEKGSWCPRCSGLFPLSIEEMQIIAESRGGKCLSDRYINANANLKWKCSLGHVWEATPTSVKNSGTWCPNCANKIKHTIEEMRTYAISKKGQCSSGVYLNNKTKLEWVCQEGHKWNARPDQVLQGHWCPHCFNKRRKKKN